MISRTKKIIDQRMGRFILSALSRFVHSCPVVHTPPKTILIMKLYGMGSLIMAKPSLFAFRNRHPNSHLVFLGTPATAAYANLLGSFQTVLELNDRHPPSLLLSALWFLFRNRHRFDLILDLEHESNLSSLFAWFIGSPRRIGFSLSEGLRHRFYTQSIPFNADRYRGENYQNLFQADQGPTSSRSTLALNDISNRLVELKDGPVVLITQCSPLLPERMWPENHFVELVSLISQSDPERRIVFLGRGKRESQSVSRIMKSVGRSHPVENFCNKKTLLESLALIESAAVVISIDSALMHASIQMGRPTVVLFGPTHPQSLVPIHLPQVRSLYASINCSPCSHFSIAPCGGDNLCMTVIRPKDVWTAAREVMNSIPRPQDRGASTYPSPVSRPLRPYPRRFFQIRKLAVKECSSDYRHLFGEISLGFLGNLLAVVLLSPAIIACLMVQTLFRATSKQLGKPQHV